MAVFLVANNSLRPDNGTYHAMQVVTIKDPPLLETVNVQEMIFNGKETSELISNNFGLVGQSVCHAKFKKLT